MLNKDVDDGLDSEFNIDSHLDLVTPPVKTAGGGNEITFVTDVNSSQSQVPVSQEQLFGDNLKPGTLPNFDAQFKIIDQNRVRIIDLKDVESSITNQDKVCQEEARMVDGVFGDFFSKYLSDKEFTKAPTKTNLARTKQFMRTKIAKEEQILISSTMDFFAVPLNDLNLFVKHIQETFVPAAKEQVLTFQSQYGQILDNIFQSKNVVLPIGQTSINIINAPIDTLTLEAVPDMVQGFETEDKTTGLNSLTSAIKALQALNTSKLKHFIFSCISGNPEISRGHEALMSDEQLTIGHLVTLYQNTLLLSGIDYLELTASNALMEFKKLMQELEECDKDFKTVNEFIVKNTPDILKQTKDLTHCYSLSRNLMLLNIAVQEVFNFLRFCL